MGIGLDFFIRALLLGFLNIFVAEIVPEKLLDLCDNISPGLLWPPQQTTICVLGPSIPSSVNSAISMFRNEFIAHIEHGGCPHD